MKDILATPVGKFDGLLGISLREYFASLAMQGLLAGVYSDEKMLKEFKRESGIEYISRNAVSYADALIAELEKTNEK